MTEQNRPQAKPPAGSPPPQSDRLDSWKDIAAYLKRDVRTAQRWEKLDGLPIRRHPDSKLGGVYAFRSELDAWWTQSRDQLSGESQAHPALPPPPPRATALLRASTRLVWGVTALVAAAAAAAGAWRFSVWRHQRPPTPSAAQWVLVLPFENHTGNADFDGVVEYAIERELANAPLIRVVPRTRVEDALSLMRRPSDDRLDRKSGRDVALRDGEINRLIDGRIDALGPSYSLSATIVRVDDGTVVGGVAETARDEPDFAAALQRLSERLRGALKVGHQVVGAAEPPLEKATTPSLKALRLYSASYELGRLRRWPAARELVEKAVAEDPTFGTAYIWLAWTRRNSGQAFDQTRDAAERALQLSDTATEWERQWIIGSYHMIVTHDAAKAIAAYDALIKLRPADALVIDWAIGNVVDTLVSAEGRPGAAMQYALRLAELRPRSPLANWNAANSLLDAGDIAAAKSFVDRIVAGSSDGLPNDVDSRLQTWALMFPMYERFVTGDIAGALAIHQRLLDRVESRHEPLTGELASAIANSALFFGRLDDARRANRYAPDVHDPRVFDALIDYYGDDLDAAHHGLRLVGLVHERPLAVWLNLRVGDVAGARRIFQTWPASAQGTPAARVVENNIAVTNRRPKSEEAFEEAIRHLGPSGILYRAVETLAGAWLSRGEADRAVDLLTRVSARRAYANYNVMPFSPFWVRDEVLLAEADDRAGRHDEAVRIARGVSRLLAFADPDLPMLGRVRSILGEAAATSRAGAASARP